MKIHEAHAVLRLIKQAIKEANENGQFSRVQQLKFKKRQIKKRILLAQDKFYV